MNSEQLKSDSDEVRKVRNPFYGVVTYLIVFKKHLGRRLYLVLLLALLAGLMEGIGISLLLPLFATLDLGIGAVDSVPDTLNWIIGSFGLAGSLGGILVLVGLMFVLKGVVLFFARAYGGILGAQLLKELKQKLFNACAGMSFEYYAAKNTGHFINVLNAQSSTFVAAFNSFVSFAIKTIQSAAYLSFAMYLAWEFGLMILAVGIVLIVLFTKVNTKVRLLSRKTARELSFLNKLEVQTLHAFKYLVSTNELAKLSDSFFRSVARVTDYRILQSLWGSFTGSIAEPVAIGLIIASILVQVGIFDQPLAPILVSILLLYRAVSTTLQVQSSWQSTLNAVGSIEMVEKELSELRRNQEKDGTRHIVPLQRHIRLKGVCYSYSDGLPNVLTDIDLEIPARSTVAIIGESGAGKSTLIDIVTLLLKPQKGEVLIDGVSSFNILLNSWRSQIGYVSQETVVFDDTIAANIALTEFGEKFNPCLFESVCKAAKKAHLSDFIESLPNKYMTIVGDRGVRLSGGQRQRLFIARELYKKPNLLILDEATSALDSNSEQAIQKSIDELHGEMTVIIIAHRLSTIRNVDTIYVLENGVIVERGTYSNLKSKKGSRLSSLVAMQSL